jgi:hypothetical protein
MAEVRSIHIGGVDYEVHPFGAYKGLLAGEIVSTVTEEAREVYEKLSEYEREYRSSHFARYPLSSVRMRGWTIPDENFTTPDDDAEPYVDLPVSPSEEERFLVAFKHGFSLARVELGKLIALCVVTDENLLAWEEADTVDKELGDLGKTLLTKARIGDLVKTLGTVVGQVQDELTAVEEDMGKLRSAISQIRRKPQTPPDTRRTVPLVGTAISKPESPTSPTSSPTPTDGPGSTSSLVPDGVASPA